MSSPVPTALLSDAVALAGMRLSPAEQRLYGADGAPIALERKAFDLLCFLVAQRERVVGKDELLQAVWGRRIASDTVIAQAVSKARKALAQGGGDADWIDVARGVGYRYVGPAEVSIPTGDAVDAVPARRRVRGWRTLLLLAACTVAGIAAGIAWQRQALLRDPLRIAVLPLRDDSADAALQWSSLGLQGLLVDALANDRRVAPLAQGNVRALLDARPDLADPRAQADYLAAATGVEHVYAGRLAREGDDLVIELVLLGGDATQSTRRAGRDAATLALAAADDLTRRLLPGFDPARPAPMSDVAFANEAYARGVDARLRGRAAEAAAHLRSALDADPALLAARYQLGLAQQLLRDNAAWKQSLEQLLQDAQARRDRVHEGLARGGLGVLAWREGRLDEAEARIRESMPFFDAAADRARLAGARGNLGSLAAMQGRFDEAERELQAALAVFEQAGMQVEIARVSKNLGVMNLDRGRFVAAREWLERSRALRQALGLERDLADTLVSLGATDLSMEAPAAAEASFAHAAEVFARLQDPLLESDALARLAGAQLAQGRLGDAEASAARSLVAARRADNAAARGLAHQRLARIAQARADHAGARAELQRAEGAMRAANDRKGLLRVALDLATLPDARPQAAEVESWLGEARDAQWRVLEAEALAVRATLHDERHAARADLAAAYTLALQIGEPALITDLACRYAQLNDAALDDTQREAEARCLAAAPRHAAAAGFRGARALAAGDRDAARHWWGRQRDLARETWRHEDRQRLEALEKE
jgi:DNA-binding winged helix-turn-helix (wHTH) protein